jgi:hypothetical protein
MRRTETEKYLTLGMALTADKKTMERRVRGVFARKSSARTAKILALTLCAALAVGCFTTACKAGTAPIASAGNATSGNAETEATRTYTKEDAMESQAQALEWARAYVAPRITNLFEEERGDWRIDEEIDPDQKTTAAEAFLAIANPIFATSYTADDMAAIFYIDETGFRGELWRFDSTDGVLSGAVEAGTLNFISADCAITPLDTAHASIAGAEGWDDVDNTFDCSDAAKRVAGILGGAASEIELRGGSTGYVMTGWSVQRDVMFVLGDGRYCQIGVYGDEDLTTYAVGVYPDADCADEDVFWRADLEHTEDVSVLLNPQDFRKGEPGADDMPVEEAYAFYYSFVNAAGSLGGHNDEPKEPNATFYVDYSGARENYWHIEGEFVTFDFTCQTKHMLNMEANQKLGNKMELMQISYDDMGGDEYVDATQALFATLYGEENIVKTIVNAVYDYHYCTVDVIMSDDTSYEVMYEDGLIVNAQFFAALDDGGWGTDPNWKADWIYVNTETGETFHMDW